MPGPSPSFSRSPIRLYPCEATEGIRESFGVTSALDYLIGEKLFSFVHASERDPEFAEELPAFVTQIRRIFAAGEISEYLQYLEQTKFLPPLEIDDLDEFDEEPWPHNPVRGAEEILRFSRIQQLLQAPQ